MLSLLKDAIAGLLGLAIAIYWRMLFKVFRLGYLCLRWVYLGFVLGAVVCIRLFDPLRLFPLIWLAS